MEPQLLNSFWCWVWVVFFCCNVILWPLDVSAVHCWTQVSRLEWSYVTLCSGRFPLQCLCMSTFGSDTSSTCPRMHWGSHALAWYSSVCVCANETERSLHVKNIDVTQEHFLFGPFDRWTCNVPSEQTVEHLKSMVLMWFTACFIWDNQLRFSIYKVLQS